MSRSTFKILFYVNKGKEKDGIVPVMGRITINGTQSQFSCKKTIPLDMWDVKGNCAKGRSKESLQVNRDLDNIKAQIIKRYQRLSDREAFVTAEMVRNSFQGFGSEYETLLNAFDKDIASLKKRVGKDRVASTLWAMQRSRNDVAEFLKSNLHRTDISMLELTPEFIKDFAAYLSIDRGLANGTIWQRCMWLKGVVLRAHYNGKIPRNPFAQFHISPNCKERAYLTEDELKAVIMHEFEDADLAFVRDIFVFVSFTALSFIDVKELTTDNIVEVNGDKWIIGRRHKTSIPFQVKLMDVPLQIIDRYKHLQEEKLVFGKMNYWSMCKKLKKVMEACGIEKQISYHCGRHSFATIALTNGMPIESVSRVLGHTNITTTQIYAKITSQKLNNDQTMLGDKLWCVILQYQNSITMKRGIIRMTEGGRVSMTLTDVWMTKEEIADMFGLPEALIFRTIRSIYKKSELYEHETANRIPFPKQESKGWTKEVYNLDLILYLTYKLPSRNAQIFRKYMTNKAYERSPYEHICIIVDDVDFRHRSSLKVTGYNLHQTEERRMPLTIARTSVFLLFLFGRGSPSKE